MLIKMDLLSPTWPCARANVLPRPFPDTYILYPFRLALSRFNLARAYIVLPLM